MISGCQHTKMVRPLLSPTSADQPKDTGAKPKQFAVCHGVKTHPKNPNPCRTGMTPLKGGVGILDVLRLSWRCRGGVCAQGTSYRRAVRSGQAGLTNTRSVTQHSGCSTITQHCQRSAKVPPQSCDDTVHIHRYRTVISLPPT